MQTTMSAGILTSPTDGSEPLESIKPALDVMCAFVAIHQGVSRRAVAMMATGTYELSDFILPEELERLNFPLSPDQWFALRELLWPPSDKDRLAARLAQQRRRHAAAEAAAAGIVAAAERERAAAEQVEEAEERRRVMVWDLKDAVGRLQPPLTLTLEELGQFVDETVGLDYFLTPEPTLTIRRPRPEHKRLTMAVANLLLTHLESMLGIIEADRLWEQSETAIRFLGPDIGDGGFVFEQICPDAGIGYVSALDGGNDNDHYFPGIVIEISFSNDRSIARRAKEYIQKSNGNIRCVVMVMVEWRPERQLMMDGLPPVGVWLDAIHNIDPTPGACPVELVHGLDVRALVASDPNYNLRLTRRYVDDNASPDETILLPLGKLLEAIDKEYGPGLAPHAPAAPPMRGYVPGKRKRFTPAPDPRESEDEDYVEVKYEDCCIEVKYEDDVEVKDEGDDQAEDEDDVKVKVEGKDEDDGHGEMDMVD